MIRDLATANNSVELERGVFTLSLDLELLWGTLGDYGPEAFRTQCELERAVIIDRLLALFVEFEIPATWCIVGHLFLDSCDAPLSRRAATCGGRDCLFCGRELVGKIRGCTVPQEIGCHSFTHLIFAEDRCARAIAADELQACLSLAAELGIELRSFVFPQNRVGHLDVLKEYGFTCYRGPESHEDGHLSEVGRRLAHLWKVCTAAQPPVYLPELTAAGIWNIPGSMFYFPMHGPRRYLPLALRVKRAVKGLRAAARQRRIFHLWFHPTNLADETERMFAGLRAILARAAELRARGELEIAPMGELVKSVPRAVASVGLGEQLPARVALATARGVD